MKKHPFLSALLILVTVCTLIGIWGSQREKYESEFEKDGHADVPTSSTGTGTDAPSSIGTGAVTGGTSVGTDEVTGGTSVGTDAVTGGGTSVGTDAVTGGTPAPEPAVPYLGEARDLSGLRDLLWSAKERGQLNVEFRYTGTETFSASDIARILATMYISYTYRGNYYTLEITEHPGVRIARAHRAGDLSALSAEERALLSRAEQTVAEIKRTNSSLYDIELAIYDYVADNVTYTNPTTEITDKNTPPRHLTALGALADGRANCQGYADAFYLLASIAGLEVSKMTVIENDDGGGHEVNTVKLNGNWYVVDATHGDLDPTCYHLFNAGRDMCTEYSWNAEWEYHRIADRSDANFYYYRYTDRCFSSLDAVAEHIKGEYLKGKKNFSLMLSGTTAKWDELSEVLSTKLNATGVAYNYHIWSRSRENNTFFTVVFK